MNFLDKLLEYYNIPVQEYAYMKADATIADVPSYNVFQNITQAKELIKEAIKNKDKILIYGDYDADGVLATSILVNTFKKLNYEVSYYIPSRYLDGYGLTSDKVIKAHEQGFKLIITVDNGITAFDAINKAKELGINLLITDHHEYEDAPKDIVFLHPKESSLSITTSGAMVSFYLSYALLDDIDPYLLTLGATSILSDAMPLKKENRQIVKLGIKYLNKYRFDKFNLLSETINYDETVLTLKVIPKINAVGRIEKNKEVNLLVKYFTSSSYRDLNNLKDYFNNVNIKRKELTDEAIKNLIINKEEAIVLKLDILNGLTGLIANRLLFQYNLPSVIFSSEEKDGCIRGSIRVKNGFNVIDFIKLNQNLFIESGGHELAAGIVIKTIDFDKFKSAFTKFTKSHPFIQTPHLIQISPEEVNLKNYEILRSFSPFGEALKEPTFLIKNVQTNNIQKFGQNFTHLKLVLNKEANVIGYNFDFQKISLPQIDLIGKFRLNKYKNYLSVNFLLEN